MRLKSKSKGLGSVCSGGGGGGILGDRVCHIVIVFVEIFMEECFGGLAEGVVFVGLE
jgi:hypothetical protein